MSIYDEKERRTILKTYNGVDVEIVRVVNSSLYSLANVKGGELATGLDGMFTTPQKAIEVFDSYNQAGIKAEKAKETLAQAKEDAVVELLAATPTAENYVKQRVEKLKQEKAITNG